jgi:hypothetical protein
MNEENRIAELNRGTKNEGKFSQLYCNRYTSCITR